VLWALPVPQVAIILSTVVVVPIEEINRADELSPLVSIVGVVSAIVSVLLLLLSLGGYSQLSVVPCVVNGFTPRVGRHWSAGYGLGSGPDFCIPVRCV
jgi:hypothetical protein